MLCFKSSKDIALDAGSDVLTDDVGVNIGILDAVLVKYFCGGMCMNFMYKYG